MPQISRRIFRAGVGACLLLLVLALPHTVRAVQCTTQTYEQDGVLFECEAWWVWNPVEGWVMIDPDWRGQNNV